MIGFLGYNFLGDIDALNPVPVSELNNLEPRVENGIFDQFNVTKDITSAFDSTYATWDINTIINAMFNNDISGGNIGEIASVITGVRIKRRRMGDFDWITINEREINSPEELSFAITDNLTASNIEYEYAFVPLIGDIEGQYIIESVLSKFNSVFIVDSENIFKLEAGVEYGETQRVQKIGSYEPYGNKYPVIISNGNLDYETGSFGGTILPDNYNPAVPIQRNEILTQKKLIIDFLNNRKPKILKDWNSNLWLCMITSNPTITYLQGSGMSMMNVSANWTEIGNSIDKQDLYDSGMIPSTN